MTLCCHQILDTYADGMGVTKRLDFAALVASAVEFNRKPLRVHFEVSRLDSSLVVDDLVRFVRDVYENRIKKAQADTTAAVATPSKRSASASRRRSMSSVSTSSTTTTPTASGTLTAVTTPADAPLAPKPKGKGTPHSQSRWRRRSFGFGSSRRSSKSAPAGAAKSEEATAAAARLGTVPSPTSTATSASTRRETDDDDGRGDSVWGMVVTVDSGDGDGGGEGDNGGDGEGIDRLDSLRSFDSTMTASRTPTGLNAKLAELHTWYSESQASLAFVHGLVHTLRGSVEGGVRGGAHGVLAVSANEVALEAQTGVTLPVNVVTALYPPSVSTTAWRTQVSVCVCVFVRAGGSVGSPLAWGCRV